MDGYEALRLAIVKVADASGMELAWAEGRPGISRDDDRPCLSLGLPQPNGKCTLLRQPLPSEGNRVSINFLDVGDGPEGVPIGTWMWLGTWARELTRIRRREQALLDAGYARTDAPDWSLTVHPALALMATTIGMDVREYLGRFQWKPTPEGWRGEPGGRGDGTADHILVRTADSVFAERFNRSGGRWDAVADLEYSDAPRRQGMPTLQILTDGVLPDTVASGAVGSDLRDIVDLGIQGAMAPTRVASISQAAVGAENQIIIELEIDAMPIAEPPLGIVGDWLAGGSKEMKEG